MEVLHAPISQGGKCGACRFFRGADPVPRKSGIPLKKKYEETFASFALACLVAASERPQRSPLLLMSCTNQDFVSLWFLLA